MAPVDSKQSPENHRNNVTLSLKVKEFEKITVTLAVTVTVITVTFSDGGFTTEAREDMERGARVR